MTNGIPFFNKRLMEIGAPVGDNDAARKIDTLLGATWTAWTPTLTGGGNLQLTGTNLNYCKYVQVGKTVLFQAHYQGTAAEIVPAGGSNNTLLFTLPVTAAASGFRGGGIVTDGGSQCAYWFTNSTTQISVRKDGSAVYTLGNLIIVGVNGVYEAA